MMAQDQTLDQGSDSQTTKTPDETKTASPNTEEKMMDTEGISAPADSKIFVQKMGGVGLGSFASIGAERQLQPRGKASNLYLSVEVGERCQLKCRHCIYGDDPEAVPHQGMPAALAQLAGNNPLWVSFSGKEPTLFPANLTTMANEAKQRNPEAKIILMTNGLLLPKVGSNIADAIDMFDISLDGDPVAHAWMRGSDALFEKTLAGVNWVVANTNKQVGIIATAVHATLPDNRQQIESIAPLAEILRKRYGDSGRVSLSVSLYYGAPSDPLRLTAVDLMRLIDLLADTSFPIRILWTASYAHLFPQVQKRFGWNMTSLRWDGSTNLPILRVGPWLDIIPFHLSSTEQIVLRLGNRGDIHLGCDHLDLGSDANRFAIGTLSDPRVALEEAKSQSRGVLDDRCQKCNRFNLCRGGDPHSGRLHDTLGHDPYCPLLN